MNTPLTREESAFAAENHGLVSKYLRAYRLPESDYYDVVIFGYLRAVRKYLSREDLRDAYKFSTIAKWAMRTEISNHFRAENCSKRRADTVPYDDETDTSYFIDAVWESVNKNCEVQTAREKLPEVLTPRQGNVVYLKADGYSNREIGEKLGLHQSSIQRDVRAARAAVRNRAPELLELFAA